ncbi:MAG: sigma-70 family RNA polymerase sigma factor [Firmicutes bacterium]|nr:sigma-70 family RNA polymerase sigma factor [Bacillota bacterium]
MAIENLMILTDEQLVLIAQEGSETAEEILIDKYKGFVLKKAQSYYITGAEPEDVVQEGMIGLLKAIRRYEFDREAGFKTYAGKCIDNQIINAIRKAEREKNQPLNDAVSFEKQVGEKEEGLTLGDVIRGSIMDEPEETVIYEDTLQRLGELSKKTFSDHETKVLKGKIQGKSYLEIAEELGKSPKTIDNALQRIKKKITDFLKK